MLICNRGRNIHFNSIQFNSIQFNLLLLYASSTFIYFPHWLCLVCNFHTGNLFILLCTSPHVFTQLCVCAAARRCTKSIFWLIYSNRDTKRGACNFNPIAIWTQEVIRLLYGLNTSSHSFIHSSNRNILALILQVLRTSLLNSCLAVWSAASGVWRNVSSFWTEMPTSWWVVVTGNSSIRDADAWWGCKVVNV